MTTAYLGLGSNLGDRMANLRRACEMLDEQPRIVIKARSRIYETQSVEGGGDGDFLNAALRIETSLSARELLTAIQGVEVALGRPVPPRFGPRAVDVDILLFGSELWDEPDLQIPHPRLHLRAFVLKPLADVLEGGWARESAEPW